MSQAVAAAVAAGLAVLVVIGLAALIIHRLRHSRSPFWWGVLVAAVLAAVAAYFNYLGR